MDFSPLDEETSKEVLRQVEFYFSDSNIPRDKFMRSTIQESVDGLVGLDLICSFKRMRGHLKLEVSKPEDIPDATIKAVADTLRKSNFLKVSADGKKVGRLVALSIPGDIIEQLDARTVAVSPLKYDVKLEDVQSFFNEYAKVSSVRLPRHKADKKLFCGTALIEFSSERDAENALRQDFVYDGQQLEVYPKKDFDVERTKVEDGICASSNQEINGNEVNYPKGLIVAFTLKKIPSGDSTDHEVPETDAHGDPSKTDAHGLSLDMNNLEHTSCDNDAEDHGMDNKSPSGAVENDELKNKKTSLVDYKKNLNVVSREDIKAVLKTYGTVKFIDFKIGEESGYVRFEEPEAAQKVRAAAVLEEGGGLAVKNFIATFEPVTGEAEKDYWKLLQGNQVSYRENKVGRGRGGKRHGDWNKQGRFKDRGSNNRPNKIQKIAA